MTETVSHQTDGELPNSPLHKILSRFPALLKAYLAAQTPNQKNEMLAEIDRENAIYAELYARARQESGTFRVTRVRYERHEGRLRFRYVVPLPLQEAPDTTVLVETRIHAFPAPLQYEARETPLVQIDTDGLCTVTIPEKDKDRIMREIVSYPYDVKIDYPLL